MNIIDGLFEMLESVESFPEIVKKCGKDEAYNQERTEINRMYPGVLDYGNTLILNCFVHGMMNNQENFKQFVLIQPESVALFLIREYQIKLKINAEGLNMFEKQVKKVIKARAIKLGKENQKSAGGK